MAFRISTVDQFCIPDFEEGEFVTGCVDAVGEFVTESVDDVSRSRTTTEAHLQYT